MNKFIIIVIIIFFITIKLTTRLELWYDIQYGETVTKPYQAVLFGKYTSTILPFNYTWSENVTPQDWRTNCNGRILRVQDPFNIMINTYPLQVKCTIEDSYVTNQL